MIKSLGPGLDSLDFLRIALGNQHLFIVIQNSNLSKPLVLTWPQLLQQIQDQLNVVAGGVTSVNGETGVVVLALDDLSDVSAAFPTSGQFLQWNGSAWVPVTVAPGGVTSVNGDAGPAVVLDLDDINDVNASSPSTNDILQFNGTNWVAATVSTGVYTADNGLSADPGNANNFQLGSASSPGAALLNDRYIDTGATSIGLRLSGQKTNATDFILYISNTASGGGGIDSETTGAGVAVRGRSQDSAGVLGSSISSSGVQGQTSATGQGGVLAAVSSAASNIIALGLRVRHTTSAAPAPGFGVSIQFAGETVAIFERLLGRLMYQWTDATDASRTSKFQIETVNGATASVKLEVLGSGQLVLNEYTTGTSFASGLTSVGVLNVDNTGKVFVGPGGGVPASRKVDTTDSLTGGGDLSADRTLKLVNDTPTPGANKVYGTDGSGNRGWKNDPTGGGSILHGTAAGTDTYTVTITGATAYADGDAYLIRFTNGNTTSATLNISDGVSSFGAVPLYRNNDGQLIGGDIVAGGEMLCVYNSTTNRFQVIGTAPNTLLSYVTNDDTVTLTKGMAVFAFGGVGDRMTVQRASNLSDSTSAQTVGLVLSSSIAPNQKGLIMMQGLLDGLNILPTATWNDGDPVFLGDTPGSITKTKPYAPKHLVYLGVVTTANNGSAGRMYVKVQNGYELDELHNVQAQSPNLNDTLYYDNTVTPAQWKTTSVNTLLNTSIKTGSCGVTFDGGGQVVQNKTAYVQIPYNGTLGAWFMVADQGGACIITVYKGTFGTFPTSSLVYATPPAIPATNQRASAALPTYNAGMATVTAGDVLKFEISAVTAITWVNLSIFIAKT